MPPIVTEQDREAYIKSIFDRLAKINETDPRHYSPARVELMHEIREAQAQGRFPAGEKNPALIQL